MRDATYDLFKGTSAENAVWIAAVKGLQAAADRMSCLALSAPDDYFLSHSGNIVASVTNPKPQQSETSPAWKIVIVSSDSNQLSALKEILKKQELEPIFASTVSQYREVLSKQPVGMVFCDSNLADGNYKDVISASRSALSKARVVVTSPLADWPECLNAMREGAFDVISRPCRPKDVEWMVIQLKRDDRRMTKELLTSDGRNSARRASA